MFLELLFQNESGREVPKYIDSLKISRYFSVSADDLFIREQLIFIEKKKTNQISIVCYDLLLRVVDLLSLMLIFLPLYPKAN